MTMIKLTADEIIRHGAETDREQALIEKIQSLEVDCSEVEVMEIQLDDIDNSYRALEAAIIDHRIATNEGNEDANDDLWRFVE